MAIKTFKVYKHPVRGLEAVKIGFSWPAFFFCGIWMIIKKLWTYIGIWVCLSAVALLVEKVTDKSVDSMEQVFVYFILAGAYFALWLIPGFKGNEWREENLTKRGYQILNTVQAETSDAAIAQVANLPNTLQTGN